MIELSDDEKRARREKLRAQLVLDLERMYPGPVRPREPQKSYSLAKKFTRYAEHCVSETHGRDAKLPLAERNSWLCRACEDRFTSDLVMIEQSWPLLESLLRPGVSQAGEKVHNSVTGSPAPLDVDVADVMGRAQGWVWSLVEHMLEDKPDLKLPAGQSPPSLLRWIRKWKAAYIFGHPCSSFPAALTYEAASVCRDIRTKTAPTGMRRLDIPAGCTEHTVNDRGERVPCPGVLTAVLRDRSSGMGAEVQCSYDSTHDIPEHRWLGLLRAAQHKEGKTA